MGAKKNRNRYERKKAKRKMMAGLKKGGVTKAYKKHG